MTTMMHTFHKKNGDEAYKNQAYHNAVFHYTLAIETARSEVETSNEDTDLKKQLASLYSKRAAASTMMRHYDEALADCDGAIDADCSYGKAYMRKAQLKLINGLLGDAIDTCNEVIQLDPDNTSARDYLADIARDYLADILEIQTKFRSAKTFAASLYNAPQDSIRREEIDSALTDVESILKTCIAWNDLKVLRAELLWALGQSDEAYKLTGKLVKKCGVVETHSSLHNLRAQILVSMGRSEDAIRHLRLVLAHDRDDERANQLLTRLSSFLALKAAADQAFKALKLVHALQKYELTMTMCPSQVYMAKLLFNHACTLASLHRHEAAIQDCSEAIGFNDEYIKAYMRRAQQYELALRDYPTAFSLCKTKHESRYIDNKIKETTAELRELRKEDLSKMEKLKRFTLCESLFREFDLETVAESLARMIVRSSLEEVLIKKRMEHGRLSTWSEHFISTLKLTAPVRNLDFAFTQIQDDGHATHLRINRKWKLRADDTFATHLSAFSIQMASSIIALLFVMSMAMCTKSSLSIVECCQTTLIVVQSNLCFIDSLSI